MCVGRVWLLFFFSKQKTAYEMRISDWSSDVCSSDLDTKGGSTALQSQFVGLPIGGIPVNELDADRTDLPFVTNVIGQLDERSEGRRVGKEGVSTCRSRWLPYH